MNITERFCSTENSVCGVKKSSQECTSELLHLCANSFLCFSDEKISNFLMGSRTCIYSKEKRKRNKKVVYQLYIIYLFTKSSLMKHANFIMGSTMWVIHCFSTNSKRDSNFNHGNNILANFNNFGHDCGLVFSHITIMSFLQAL